MTSLRVRKVAERFNELEGKNFRKISEAVINAKDLVDELKKSLNELEAAKKKNTLQYQQLERAWISATRNFNQLKKNLS